MKSDLERKPTGKECIMKKDVVMTRAEFLVYEGHFNAKEYDKVVSYFAPDCTVVYPDLFLLGPQTPNIARGPDDFIKRYTALHENFREFLDLGIFLSDDKNMIVEFQTEFHCIKEADYWGGHLKVGDFFAVNQFCVYDFNEDGKFSRIRISHHQVLSNDPDFKPLHSYDE